jgi:2-oxoglutarate dehydrogenase E2 component (dihydrolipoamide succinyltransferase)
MTTPIEVRAPAEHSEGTRSQVQRWLKAPGDAVFVDEPLLELETDKVTVEIAAPASGTLQEILKPEQAEVEPGELLATIAASGDALARSSLPAARSPLPVAREPLPTASAPATGRERLPDREANASPSPAVRRLLSERGLTAADVRGTGHSGRITVEDVLAQPAGGVPAREVAPVPEGASHLQPHSTMRRRIAERMVESLRVAPHVTTVFEADLSAVLAHRARHRTEFERRGVSLTLTAYFMQACVAAARAVPEANSRWTDSALELHDAMHIGVATALGDRGLVVPVVRDVQALDLFGIARALGELVTRARSDRLAPADVRGGTFTISNHGVSGSLLASPIVILQPQAAILGIGRLEKRAVVVSQAGEDRIIARPRCYVTLTIDHRVMDGERANRFLEVLVQGLEQVSN